MRNTMKTLLGRVGFEPTTHGLKDRKTIVAHQLDWVGFRERREFLIGAGITAFVMLFWAFSLWVGNSP